MVRYNNPQVLQVMELHLLQHCPYLILFILLISSITEASAASFPMYGHLPLGATGNVEKINLAEWYFYDPAAYRDSSMLTCAFDSKSSVSDFISRERAPGSKIESYGPPLGRLAQEPRIISAPTLKGNRSGYVWVVSELDNCSPGRTIINVNIDGKFTLFVNGNPIGLFEAPRGEESRNTIFYLDLQSGKNVIAIKLWGEDAFLVQLHGSIDLQTAISDTIKSLDSIFSDRVLSPQNTLGIRVARGVENEHVSVSVKNSVGEIIFSSLASLWSDLDLPQGLACGCYIVNISGSFGDYCESIFIGDPLRFVPPELGTFEIESYTIYRNRFNVLTSPGNYKLRNRNWQHKFINCVLNLDKIYFADEALNRSGRAVAASSIPRGDASAYPENGHRVQLINESDEVKLVGFKSKLDNTIRGYRIYVPSISKISKSTDLPLVLLLSPAISTPRPFIESPLVADHLQSLEILKAAESLGVIVVWVGYRNIPSGSPSELSHIYEVIENVEGRIGFDRSRASIIAKCEAGITATQLLSDSSGRFSACVYINAYFEKDKNIYFDGRYAKQNAYKAWLDATCGKSIFASQKKLSTSILVVHRGVDAVGHGELDCSKHFINEASSAAIGIKSDLGGGLHSRHDDWYQYILWASNQRNTEAKESETGYIYKSVTDIGPIQKLFQDKFVIMSGFSASSDDKIRTKLICQKIMDRWCKDYFSEGFVVEEKAGLENEKRCNVLVVGRWNPNAMVGRYGAVDGVDIAEGHIVIDGNKFVGRDLCLHAILRTKTSSGASVAIITANSSDTMYLDNSDIFTEGWYDYAVWQNGPKGARLVYAGYYSR